jgi:hypothetical protein
VLDFCCNGSRPIEEAPLWDTCRPHWSDIAATKRAVDSGGTYFSLPLSVVTRTNSTIALLAAPSFQDGSGSACCAIPSWSKVAILCYVCPHRAARPQPTCLWSGSLKLFPRPRTRSVHHRSCSSPRVPRRAIPEVLEAKDLHGSAVREASLEAVSQPRRKEPKLAFLTPWTEKRTNRQEYFLTLVTPSALVYAICPGNAL